MALRPTNAHLAVITAGTAHTFTRLSIGTGHRTPDGTETALVAPFSPAKQVSNPPGVVDQNTRAADWIDGATGDNVSYTASEAGLWATPMGGSEYLALYDSHATNDIFVKPLGSIIAHRFLIMLTYAQLANATFNVTATPQGTETIAGVLELGDNDEYDAAEASARNDRAISIRGFWRMFTPARIAAQLSTLAGDNRFSYTDLKDTPDLSGFATSTSVQNAINARTAATALTDQAIIAWNFDDGAIGTVTLGGNRTLAVPTNGRDNNLYLLRVTQDGTGSRTLALHSSIDRGDLPAPTLTTTANRTDVLGFMKWGNTVHYLGILKGY